MRNIAIILCLICIGYYGWGSLEQWLIAPDDLAGNSKGVERGEVFPDAISNIVPVTNLSEYIKQQKHQTEIRESQLQEKVRLQKQLELQQPSEELQKLPSAPYQKPEINNDEFSSEEISSCWCIGPISNKLLPTINRSIESAKLLENVQVEAILSPDSYVVFIIPTTTQKGAQALVTQVRKQGYLKAHVISEGPLLNAVQLGSFSEELDAQEFLVKAKDRLKMKDLRVTRLIGHPTDKVNLIFTSLSDKQTETLKGLARRHGQTLHECVF